MKDYFLGRPWHWGLLLVAVCLLWWAGAVRLHVIYFNGFVVTLLLGVAIALIAIIRSAKPGEALTRDPLPSGNDE